MPSHYPERERDLFKPLLKPSGFGLSRESPCRQSGPVFMKGGLVFRLGYSESASVSDSSSASAQLFG